MLVPTPRLIVPGFVTLVLATAPAFPVFAGGAIQGTIHIQNGRHFSGPIRWDLNEIFWDDVLDAEKHEKVWVEGGTSSVTVFGLTFNDDDGYWTHHPFKIQFGHLANIEPRGDDRVSIELKNGEHIDVQPTGSDLSESMRSLVITDRDKGDVEISWDEIDRVEFAEGSAENLDAKRLYGLVETSAGGFTGFIAWDKDEALTTDILDGEAGDEKHKIAFGEIREIERISSRAARVTRTGGETLRLSGTNDVNDGNRGIDVLVPDLGVIKIPWDEFDRVEFQPAPPSRGYADFDGGRRLYGTLTDSGGETFTGYVTWDLDEQYTWEFLDGQQDDLEFEIPFDLIRSISRESRREAEVRLKNGEKYVLSSSNDVDRDNKGIVIELLNGEEMEFDWHDFASLEFSDP